MLRHSRMQTLGSPAANFSLPDPSGRLHSLRDFDDAQALLVAFICNHCPFVKHILPAFVDYARDYRRRGVAVVAISSNDIESHPDDAPEHMAQVAARHGFTFPYLYDESQQVALAYEAVCTPDLFLYDRQRRLFYRGQFDGSRPYTEWDVKLGHKRNTVPVNGADLRAATDALLAGSGPPEEQRAAAGCSIKWKPENEPDWS
jgi:peroxiredoxin